MQRNLLSLFRRIVTLSPTIPEEVAAAAGEIADPGAVSDFIAAALNLTFEERLDLLQSTDAAARLRRTTALATRELEVLELGSQIQDRIRAEMDKGQREFYLREQLKQVQRELGELTGEKTEVDELRSKLDDAGLSAEARKQADDELARLERIPPVSPEYGIIRTYLDWMISLPWIKRTPDNLDLSEAQQVLDRDHYDLDKVKERILEYLAVH